jgi:hypothetical protein
MSQAPSRLLLAYEQGFLPDDEIQDLELHMRDGCEECRRTRESVTGTWPEMFPATGLSGVSADAYQVMALSGLR